MNIEAVKAGMVVKSSAGHDSGRYHVVTEVKNGFVYIADGKHRKTDGPKKKNPCHLKKTSTVIDLSGLTDKKLRALLTKFDHEAEVAEESD